MCINQTLKRCWVNFLSESCFESKEFKDIKKMFVAAYPEFRSKKLYQKIYQSFREVQSSGLVLVDTSTCTYKYTSAYQGSHTLNDLIKDKNGKSVRLQMHHDYVKLQDEVEKIKLEIEILAKYKKLYPAIIEKISRYALEKRKYLEKIQSEISILNNLIHAS